MSGLWPRKMGGKLDGTAAIALPAGERYVHIPLPTAIHASDFRERDPDLDAVLSEGFEFAMYVLRCVPFSAGARQIDVIVQADPDLSTEEIGWRVLQEALGAMMPYEADVR